MTLREDVLVEPLNMGKSRTTVYSKVNFNTSYPVPYIITYKFVCSTNENIMCYYTVC
jgi:hypothetical protein